MMTIQAMAQSALDVQSACNLSGVIRSFAEIVHSMRSEHGMDTPTCNTHPVCILFAEQIAHLTTGHMIGGDAYFAASKACEALAKEPPLKLRGPMMPLGGVRHND